MVYAATVWPKPCLPFAYFVFRLQHCFHSIVQNRTKWFAYCAQERYPSGGPGLILIFFPNPYLLS